MGWLIFFGVILVLVWAFSASNGKAGMEKISAIANAVGTEDAFRRYLHYFNDRLVGDPLSHEREAELMQKFYLRHKETAGMMLTITPNNHKLVLPMVGKRSDQLDVELAAELGTKATQKWSQMTAKQRETFGKQFAETQLGLKL